MIARDLSAEPLVLSHLLRESLFIKRRCGNRLGRVEADVHMVIMPTQMTNNRDSSTTTSGISEVAKEFSRGDLCDISRVKVQGPLESVVEEDIFDPTFLEEIVDERPSPRRIKEIRAHLLEPLRLSTPLQIVANICVTATLMGDVGRKETSAFP